MQNLRIDLSFQEKKQFVIPWHGSQARTVLVIRENSCCAQLGTSPPKLFFYLFVYPGPNGYLFGKVGTLIMRNQVEYFSTTMFVLRCLFFIVSYDILYVIYIIYIISYIRDLQKRKSQYIPPQNFDNSENFQGSHKPVEKSA